MKKLLSIVLVAVLALTSLVGCGEKKSVYKDGKYRVEAKEAANGWKEFVEIEIKDGKVAAIDFDATNAEGLMKTKDPSYREAMEPVANNYPEKFYPEMEEQYKANPNASEMKNITGATVSANNFKAMVSALETQMKEGKTETLVFEAPQA